MREFWSNLDDVVSYELFRVGATQVTIASLLVLVISTSAFFILARILAAALNRTLVRRTDIGAGGAFAFSRMVQYAIIVIGVLVSFQVVGLDVSSLALLLGAIGIGIGFGLQNLTSNFIAGVLMLFERPINVGDRVQVGDVEGDVLEINMRATTVRSIRNVAIIVPNSEFITSTVVNWSHGDPRLVATIDVGVSYDSNLDTVLRSLREVADEHPGVLREPPPEVRLLEFGDSSWNMRLLVWIAEAKDHQRLTSDLNKSIVRKFRANGVEIPFPQRDLHWRSPTPIPIISDDADGIPSEHSQPT